MTVYFRLLLLSNSGCAADPAPEPYPRIAPRDQQRQEQEEQPAQSLRARRRRRRRTGEPIFLSCMLCEGELAFLFFVGLSPKWGLEVESRRTKGEGEGEGGEGEEGGEGAGLARVIVF